MARVFDHEALLRARLELNLTQEEIAGAVGVDVRTYRRYESGAVNEGREGFSVRQPTRRRLIECLCAELGLSEEELLIEPPAPAGALPGPVDPPRSPAAATTSAAPVTPPTAEALAGPSAAGAAKPEVPMTAAPFHVPFARNPHFVGRTRDLATLHDLLQKAGAVGVRPAALTGMGGIGKTQLAVEYVHHHRDDYPGGVYWVNAARGDWRPRSRGSRHPSGCAPTRPPRRSDSSGSSPPSRRTCGSGPMPWWSSITSTIRPISAPTSGPGSSLRSSAVGSSSSDADQRELRVWEPATAREVSVLRLSMRPSCWSTSANGRVLVIGDEGGEVHVLDVSGPRSGAAPS